jgi:hypothetical protein
LTSNLLFEELERVMTTNPTLRETRNCPAQHGKNVTSDMATAITTDILHLPPYGHACCPHCKTAFDLAEANPTFFEPVPYNDAAVFFMCPKCHASYQTASNSGRKSMANTCFANIRPIGSPRTRHAWAITSMLVIELNNFDIIAAMENGHGLTHELYLGICTGLYELVVLPGGVRIVTSKPVTKGAL